VTKAVLVEGQLLRGCGADGEGLEVQEEVWAAVEAAAAEAGAPHVAGAAAQADAFLDLMLAPGRFSRRALRAALSALGCGGGGAAAGAVMSADLPALRAALPGWLAAGRAAGEGAGLRGWCALTRAYAAAYDRDHRPLALVQQLTHKERPALVVVRSGGMVSALRDAEPAELAARGLMHPSWGQLSPPGRAAARGLLLASGLVAEALGGPLTTRLMWGCLRRGASPQAVLGPAAVRAIAAGAPAAGAPAAGAPAAPWRPDWRAHCRRLPLALMQQCGCAPGEFAEGVQALLVLLGQQYHPQLPAKRSPMVAPTRQVAAAALATAAQVAGAQVECVLHLHLLASYVEWSQTLGAWALSQHDGRLLVDAVLPAAGVALTAATVAYWAAVTPVAAPDDAGAGDAAAAVVALRLGADGAGGGGGGSGGAQAPKRARLSPCHDRYAGELLLASWFRQQGGHAVRDVLDVQSVGAAFARWMLCVRPVVELEPPEGGSVGVPPAMATLHALSLAPLLFRGRHAGPLAELLRLLREPGDARLQFFAACAKVAALRAAGGEAERQALEDDSAALFFCVSAIFKHRDFFAAHLQAVLSAVAVLHADTARQPLPDEGPDAWELQYYETLVGVYERAGRPRAASRFALAAARHVAAALPGEAAAPARVQREGRLWANVFTFCLEGGEFEAAYAALLGSQVGEVQVDCVRRLVHALCAARRVDLLCRLPFAHTMLVAREGGAPPAWVPLLEEAEAALRRRAANLDLAAAPQPYRVLYDFYAARGNWQAAAGAQLALARRLAAERPGERGAAEEAQRALGAALGALSLVEPEQAWLEDPAPRAPPAAAFGAGAAAAGGRAGAPPPGEAAAPQVLTLEALRREYAAAGAHAAVAAAMPGGEATSGAPDDVFHQLLALGEPPRCRLLLMH
jgi:hypothetical protein